MTSAAIAQTAAGYRITEAGVSDTSTPHLDLSAEDARIERDILDLLCKHEPTCMWTVGELQLELGNALAVTDALHRLEKSGLVHRCDGLVLISRAAGRVLGLTQL